MKAKRKAKPEYSEKPKNMSFAERVVKAAAKVNTPKISSRQQELMHAFNFTDSDLMSNILGQLSEQQGKRILKRERLKWLLPMIFGFLLSVPLIIGIGFFALLYFMNPDGDIIVIELIFSLILTIGLFIFLFGFQKRKAIQADINHKRVTEIKGTAIVDIGDRNRKPKLTINDYQFNVKRDALLRIKHLEPHIVHFLPRSKIIVSVEVVE